MTDAELDRLADLIARSLLSLERGRTGRPVEGTWLPTPVRPSPPDRGAEPPPWSGAAQDLDDVAPSAHPRPPARFRASVADLTRATRAAAAGKAPPRDRTDRASPHRLARQRPAGAAPIEVRVGVSNRHVHLSEAHARRLFGDVALTVARPLTQPGQFAATQTVTVEGPQGRIDRVRVVGPTRAETQLELARADASLLGVDPPVAASGAIDMSIGGLTLVGPSGRVELGRGVIVAARHLHLAPADARGWGLRDGDLLDIRAGVGARAATLHDVLVRSGEGHATELHLDSDEARAVGVSGGEIATIVAWHSATPAKRRLVTERDVIRMARSGERVPANVILTPSARDRATALGILDS